MSKDTISDILLVTGAIIALYWIWVVLQMLIHIPRVGGAAPGQRKRLLFGGIALTTVGYILHALGITANTTRIMGEEIAPPALGLSLLFIIGGGGVIAMAKGRHMAWGLLGLLSCIGLTLLLCLKDHDILPLRSQNDEE